MKMDFRKAFILQCLACFTLNHFLPLCMANAETIRTIDWVVEETEYTRLCSRKKILTMNGQFPGPTLYVRKGETIRVNIHNKGNYNVTIHWHGVKQPRNPWSDGPEYVTQCPIKPGASFTYEVVFSDEEGTLWWHAHSDWSRATVHGPIIIHPKPGTTYPFPKPDAEFPVILASWYRGDVMKIINKAREFGGLPNISNAFTINGQPGDFYECSKPGTLKFEVEYGKTYLLRLINSVMNDNMFLAIANHTLKVVGMDGAYLKPLDTTYVMITPGQTMDVLIKANQTPNRYYIASRAYRGVATFDPNTTTAYLTYKGNYFASSAPSLPNLPDYVATDAATNFTAKLKALNSAEHPIDVPKHIDTRLFITVSINLNPCESNLCEGPHGNRISASLNNMSFVFPSTDILQAYYKRINGVFKRNFPKQPLHKFNYTFDAWWSEGLNHSHPTTKAMVFKHNAAVEMVLQGTSLFGPQNHPMHLHGHSFYVVGSGIGNFNSATDPKNYNLVDPPLLNTVGVPADGWSTIRFRANNPGVWFMHCHLERHASWGLASTVIVRNGRRSAAKIRKPPPYLNPC